ncbi:DNA-binding transcriptional regulator, MarR family [Jatrophihabitans endophyticus]|uniref:DNA-binding transcriptional regulator, MarR family n=1 Tax=Jatrophihabitans endophyticus TaxID=1206085 RepID=A0A1M5C7Z0_9ACTN|nr:MarR family transcriptional regulator [Jatrophihabitans endophyticus]SHF50512.1 DNA-binding transcriptional regulator, MarR family [Jatrophihabitans endophyticus]
MRTRRPTLDEATIIRRATTSLDARARAERHGELSLNSVSVLGRIMTQGPLTPGELARQLRMLPQSLTRPLAALERAGLVRRTPDPADRRGALLAATAAGRRALRREMAPRTRWLADAIDAVCDEDDLATLLQAAQIMQRLAGFDGGGVAPVEP